MALCDQRLALDYFRLSADGRLQGANNIYYAQGYAGHGLNVSHLAARLLVQAICAEQDSGLQLFQRVPHPRFPGAARLRSPLLALGMLWYRLRELLGEMRPGAR
jgi:hypothetical protein